MELFPIDQTRAVAVEPEEDVVPVLDVPVEPFELLEVDGTGAVRVEDVYKGVSGRRDGAGGAGGGLNGSGDARSSR
jgi:hypothetical protein